MPRVARIVSTARFLPPIEVPNEVLKARWPQLPDFVDKMEASSGIRTRFYAPEEWATSDLALPAAKLALERAGLTPLDLDLIILGTDSPDYVTPATSVVLQGKLGAKNAGTFDVGCACASFPTGIAIGSGLIAANPALKNVLVLGAEVNSAIVNWKDRDTCILFGDGAGAAIFSAHASDTDGVLSMKLGGDGSFDHLLNLPNSGCRHFPDAPGRFITMQGNEVFKQAVRNMSECAISVLETAGLAAGDVSLLIPHQANTRIIDAVAKRLNIPEEKVFVNIADYGNTSAATIPIALCEAVEQGRLKKGDVLVIDAFGAGLTWGALAMRWA